MTGLKYLSEAETLMKSKKKHSKSAHNDKAPATPTSLPPAQVPLPSTPISAEEEILNRLLGSYRDLEDEDNYPNPAQVQSKSKQISTPRPAMTPQGQPELPDKTKMKGAEPIEDVQPTLPSTKKMLVRRASLRRDSLRLGHLARLALTDESKRRLSSIVESEVSSSTERVVTMTLAEVPMKLMSPHAQIIARGEPERLVSFKVNFHPMLDTIGMSVAMAIHQGFAVPIDRPMTPDTIAVPAASRLQANDRTPADASRNFSRLQSKLNQVSLPVVAETSDATEYEISGALKPIHVGKVDLVPRAAATHSNNLKEMLGKYECFNANLTVQVDKEIAALNNIDSSFTIGDNSETPVLPEFNFHRASGNFGSLFDRSVGNLRTNAADALNLPGFAQRGTSSEKDCGGGLQTSSHKDTNDGGNAVMDPSNTLNIMTDLGQGTAETEAEKEGGNITDEG
ncbi:hypothetical protein BKA67DRAFT_658150 [Truncatella angustata]|uniref:Uncharacterized protein n=1 Tax=Truncatella angustata TaxID=152316 RepID=A0A9P8ZXB3_9PEZI|nr:uncharacterized protein BKA67DRAFT_658150 [Truncatella angustata]KAH6653809.1 hypothetical protein BKA67DRAFT_658150 [Truncatella angustata]